MREPHLNPNLSSPLDTMSLAALRTQSVNVDDWATHTSDGEPVHRFYGTAEVDVDLSYLVEALVDALHDVDADPSAIAAAGLMPSNVTVSLVVNGYYVADCDANREALSDALEAEGFDIEQSEVEDFIEGFDFGDIEQDSFDGPMMNYYYPLPAFDLDPEEAAMALDGVSLCLVEFEDLPYGSDYTFALALTGGGMDFSWSIQEAFLRLGYLAPLYCLNFPWERKGRGPEYILRAAIESARIYAERMTGDAQYAQRKAETMLATITESPYFGTPEPDGSFLVEVSQVIRITPNGTEGVPVGDVIAEATSAACEAIEALGQMRWGTIEADPDTFDFNHL